MTTLYAYPATVEQDGSGKVSVYFDGLPGSTWGESEAEALDRATDLLATSIEILLEDGSALPEPTPANGRPIISAQIG